MVQALGMRSVGTRRWSSSNQFWTKMTSGQRAFRPALGCSRSTRAAECTDGQYDPAGDETEPANRRDRPEPADAGHGE